MCLDIGTPKNINFSFETNGKLIALGVPILKQFRVCSTNVFRLKPTENQGYASKNRFHLIKRKYKNLHKCCVYSRAAVIHKMIRTRF